MISYGTYTKYVFQLFLGALVAIQFSGGEGGFLHAETLIVMFWAAFLHNVEIVKGLTPFSSLLRYNRSLQFTVLIINSDLSVIQLLRFVQTARQHSASASNSPEHRHKYFLQPKNRSDEDV